MRRLSGFVAALFFPLWLLSPFHAANAYTFSLIYSFHDGTDGGFPNGDLVLDNTGNLYGTTISGGTECGQGSKRYGCGIAFALTPNGTQTVLHNFGGAGDGRSPRSLTHERDGSFYGSTLYGGEINGGTVFSLSPDGSEKVLHSFSGTGRSPSAVIRDDAGDLFGTSDGDGGCHALGCGRIFEVAPDGSETTLHTFHGHGDGLHPSASLVEDKLGNLYGTTFWGGDGTACQENPPVGCGTVFKLAPDDTESILYSFSGGNDGSNPSSRLAIDSAGNLYGTTQFGGAYGYGVVFKLAAGGTETVLHSFAAGNDGELPGSVRLLDNTGNLYGTTQLGGGTGCQGRGCGTVFSVSPDGGETILYAFKGRADGAFPADLLSGDGIGNIYGAAQTGGKGSWGTLFKLAP